MRSPPPLPKQVHNGTQVRGLRIRSNRCYHTALAHANGLHAVLAPPDPPQLLTPRTSTSRALLRYAHTSIHNLATCPSAGLRPCGAQHVRNVLPPPAHHQTQQRPAARARVRARLQQHPYDSPLPPYDRPSQRFAVGRARLGARRDQ